MKVSKNRRIKIAVHVIETRGDDCIGSYVDCCGCPMTAPCYDSDEELMVKYADIWLKSEKINYIVDK